MLEQRTGAQTFIFIDAARMPARTTNATKMIPMTGVMLPVSTVACAGTGVPTGVRVVVGESSRYRVGEAAEAGVTVAVGTGWVAPFMTSSFCPS